MAFYDRLQALCKKNGINIYNLEKALNISNGSLGRCRYGGVPKAERLQMVADYFGVPVTYLLSGEMPAEENKDGYYADPAVKELAQFLYENPAYKVLFDASRNVKPEDILFVKAMLDRLNGGTNSGTDIYPAGTSAGNDQGIC